MNMSMSNKLAAIAMDFQSKAMASCGWVGGGQTGVGGGQIGHVFILNMLNWSNDSIAHSSEMWRRKGSIAPTRETGGTP